MVDEPVAKTNDENFAAAFEQLAELGDKPVTQTVMDKIEDEANTPVKPPEPAAAEPAKAAEEEVETELELTPGAKTAEEVAAEAAAAAAGTKPAEKPDDELLNRFADIARRAAEMQPPVEQQQQPQQQQPQPEPDIYTAEDRQLMSDFEKDYPDIARASALVRRGEYRDILRYMFSEVTKRYDPILPVVQSMAERTHLRDLETATPDYNDVRDRVIEWADAQPAYLRPAYIHVINNGTVDEVKDLINRYKSETGATIAKPAAAAPAAKPDTELPSRTKKAVAALAPVSSKRTTANPQTAPDDFDGAFAEAAKQLADS